MSCLSARQIRKYVQDNNWKTLDNIYAQTPNVIDDHITDNNKSAHKFLKYARHPTMVRWLSQHGACITENEIYTISIDAIYKNNTEIIRSFIENNTEARRVIITDPTILSRAILLEKVEIVRLLAENGAQSMSKVGIDIATAPLIVAYSLKNIEIIKILIRYNITFIDDIIHIKIEGNKYPINAPFYYAISTGNPEIISAVVLAGVDTETLTYYIYDRVIYFTSSGIYFRNGTFKRDLILRTERKNKCHRIILKVILEKVKGPLHIPGVLKNILDFSDYEIPSKTFIEALDTVNKDNLPNRNHYFAPFTRTFPYAYL